MLWLSIRIATTYDFMENFHFLSFNNNPRFPLFLQYVRCKSGVAFVRRCFRDANALQKITCHVRYKKTHIILSNRTVGSDPFSTRSEQTSQCSRGETW